MKNDLVKKKQIKIIYIKNQVKDKAFKHLYLFLESVEEEEDILMLEDVIKYLTNIFKDSAKQINVQQKLKNLKCHI